MFRQHTVVTGIILLLSLAVFLEAFQLFVPRRMFNWLDMTANVAGLLLGTFFVAMTLRKSGFRT